MEGKVRGENRLLILVFVALVLAHGDSDAHAQEPALSTDPARASEFFEKRIRPLLVENCLECHGPSRSKAGLRLDSLVAITQGGDSGSAIEPGNPDESLLIEAVRYDGFVQMPPKSKLSNDQIQDLERWVAMGAPWPDDERGTDPLPSEVFDMESRADHWCFQPVRRRTIPDVKNPSWPRSPIDRFILAEIEKQGLTPAADADSRTWLRRVTFDLIGLPPTPSETATFLADDSPLARSRVVERLLASPRYGERWGRHWLDLVRFASTAGHEFDYDIPNAWKYRDYVVRALNADVPFHHFVVEHIAGDLLEDPRRDPLTGTNESILGTGFFQLHEGTHSPVDVLDDSAARIDNQIDVLSKTFLGLTVACARCHDHKFDPITQRDYYALAGILRSSRHQQAFLDDPDSMASVARELVAQRHRIESRLRDLDLWPQVQSDNTEDSSSETEGRFIDFAEDDFENWFVEGHAFDPRATPKVGAVRVVCGPDGPSLEYLPGGWLHSGVGSDRFWGIVRSPTFRIEAPRIHIRAVGTGGRINLVVDGFEKIRDPIYGGLTVNVDTGATPRWYTMDVAPWIGHRAYLEFADGGTVDFRGPESRIVSGEGWIGLRSIWFTQQSAPPEASGDEPHAIPIDPDDSMLSSLVAEYTRVEATIPAPSLGLATTEGTGEDAPLLIRGSTRNPGESVPRRFLEVLERHLGSPEVPRTGSGRADLARRIANPENPLTARVIVNRVWKHHFGFGIVPTPDDFGHMGQPPTHPELLDWLAAEFVDQGWSLKTLHRQIVLSRAYGLASTGEAANEAVDPTNRWLHRANVTRLEAEAIRDSLLAVSGRLSQKMGGPGVPPHLTTFMEGRGRPKESGPLDGDARRSLYIDVRRNFLPPMLLAFDFPSPATTIGRRNVSNVPAQALTLLNDPFVVAESRHWAGRILQQHRSGDSSERIEIMFLEAFGRPPSRTELLAAQRFVESNGSTLDAWAGLAHVLWNVKEFLFLR